MGLVRFRDCYHEQVTIQVCDDPPLNGFIGVWPPQSEKAIVRTKLQVWGIREDQSLVPAHGFFEAGVREDGKQQCRKEQSEECAVVSGHH